MKAAIAFGGDDPPRTHDLVALWRAVRRRHRALPEPPLLDALSDAAQAARYPDPSELPYDRAEAGRLIDAAAGIIELVNGVLGDGGLDVSHVRPV